MILVKRFPYLFSQVIRTLNVIKEWITTQDPKITISYNQDFTFILLKSQFVFMHCLMLEFQFALKKNLINSNYSKFICSYNS